MLFRSLPIGGRLGQAFGVCAHDLSPSDGHVVALDHGCGAHSDVEPDASPVSVTELIIDDEQIVVVDRSALGAEAFAAQDDVRDAHEADDDAGPRDVAPPQEIPFSEDAAAKGGEDGEDGPGHGADDARADAVDIQTTQ